MIKGKQDIKEIKNLMKQTNDNVTHHMDAFLKIRNNIEELNKAAETSINELSFYDDGKSDMSVKNKDLGQNIIYEEDEEAMIENEGKNISLEDDKMSIYSRLESMA